MLAIRLFRTGKRNQPFFKVIVTDIKKSSTRGRFVEQVGFYNPLTKERKLDIDKIKHWLSVGVKPSPTVYNMLVSDKIVEGKKIPKHKITKKTETPVESAAESVKPTESENKKDESVTVVAEEQKPAEIKTEEVPSEPTETPIVENATQEDSLKEEKLEVGSGK